MRPDTLLLANHPRAQASKGERELEEQVGEVDELERIAGLFRAHPRYAAPEEFAGALKKVISSGRYRVFGEN